MNLKAKYTEFDKEKISFFQGIRMFGYSEDGSISFMIDGTPMSIPNTHWFYLYRDDEWMSPIHEKEFKTEIEE